MQNSTVFSKFDLQKKQTPKRFSVPKPSLFFPYFSSSFFLSFRFLFGFSFSFSFFLFRSWIGIDTSKLFWVTKFLRSLGLKSWKESWEVNQFNTPLLHSTKTKWTKLLLSFFKCWRTHTLTHSLPISCFSFTWLDCPSDREKNNVHGAPGRGLELRM